MKGVFSVIVRKKPIDPLSVDCGFAEQENAPLEFSDRGGRKTDGLLGVVFRDPLPRFVGRLEAVATDQSTKRLNRIPPIDGDGEQVADFVDAGFVKFGSCPAVVLDDGFKRVGNVPD